MTVFLTTQYLEEADVLADRVGIIEPRQARRRGHAGRRSRPRSGDPTVEVVAGRAVQTSAASSAVLERFGEPLPGDAAGPPPCASTDGTEGLAEVVRALDAEGVAVADLQLHAPTPRRRLPRQDRPLAGGRRGRGSRSDELAAERGETGEREAVTAGAR